LTFTSGKELLKITITKHYIIKNIYFYKEKELVETIEDFFVVSEKNILKFKNIIKNFDTKTQQNIINTINEYM